jgi:hypothetical protein
MSAHTAFINHLKVATGLNFSPNAKAHLTQDIDSGVKKAGLKVVYVPQLHYSNAPKAKPAPAMFTYPAGVANSALRKGVVYTNADIAGFHFAAARTRFRNAWKVIDPKIEYVMLLRGRQVAWRQHGETHCASNGIHEPFVVK